MDWNSVTVNPVAAGIIGVVWQWARGTSVPHWLSTIGAAALTVVAYVATVRPEAPAEWIGWFDIAFHAIIWLALAFGLGRAVKGRKVAGLTVVPETRRDFPSPVTKNIVRKPGER